MRPTHTQTLERDLTVTSVTDIDEVEFDDWTAFGVKAANLAVLRTLGFPGGTVPDGHAIPFYFYDEFMKHNGFYDDVREMLADTEFQTDFDTQEDELSKLRKKIKQGDTPEWMTEALEEMHAAYPEGQSPRYRSSTNNEDLPGFNGAGLYDSKTQNPEETEEDGIAKSLKQVYASLWNFRAFNEREFHRVDHLTAAMGVLVHPNYSDELANGVAVTFNPLNGTHGRYYVNTQVGEDLVTNPEAHSIPEEILISRQDSSYVVRSLSNLLPPGQLLMSNEQIAQLKSHLATIREEFSRLYDPPAEKEFEMEIEFKITSDNVLAIKQARPWVFYDANQRPRFPNTETGTRSIAEDAPAGVDIGRPVAAVDPNPTDTLTYSISGDDAASFEIDPSTGQIRTKAPLDDGAKAVHTVTVSVHDGMDSDGNTDTSVDDSITVTIRVNLLPTGLPAINGTPKVDETLSVDTTTIADADGLNAVTFGYRWIRSDGVTDTDIEGATDSTYTLVDEDADRTIKVRVTFTDDADNQESLTSKSTSVVQEATNSWSATLTVETRDEYAGYSYWGNPHLGSLSAAEVEWDGKTHYVRFLFLKDGELRLGLNEEMFSTGFVLSVGDEEFGSADAMVDHGGASYRFRWDDPGLGWSDGNEVSVNLVESDQNTPALGAPTTSGTVQVDETLTADISGVEDADGLDNVSYSYQWIRNDGNNDTNIVDATDMAYTLTDDDFGSTTKVRVTFTRRPGQRRDPDQRGH